ncbi:ATP-dependent DNA helicase DinG, partial [Pseudomonas syringae pv. actinidiae ICMP 19079]
DLKADPRDSVAHTAAIIRDLPGLVEGSRGTLVLYSSRKQMQDVFDGLGESSVLFGLASFAEGVDLPGAYCEHVVIAKIPFAVPDD